MKVVFGLLTLLTSVLPPAVAQVPDHVNDMLRRIFASADFAPQRFGPARWIENGAAYTTVEKSAAMPDAFDIVRYETATGARSVYISARQLVPSGASEALDFDDYAWSADGNLLLLFTSTQRVWRQNTRGDYWVLDRKTGALKKLGGPNAPPSTLMYAKFSPTVDRVAYVRQGNVYAERLSDGAITALTTDADSLHVNGMTDWVYEEEFDLRDAFRWSPDGSKIAYWRFDMTGLGTYFLINDTDSLYPKITPIQYPKVGTQNSAVRAGVVSADGGPTTWLQIPDDSRENYLPRMEWAGPNELILQRMNRLQNTDRVILADAATGATRTVLTERDSAWVDVEDEIEWLAKGTEFLWTSERDGWRHVYRVSRDGKRVTNITPGNFDVVDIAKQRTAVAPLIAGHGEFFKVTVSDGISLDGWMIKPANFDSTKAYPLLMYVYGEPAGQTAQDSWGGGHLWEHLIADQGYVVATVDNRGTPSPRGRAWRKVVYGAIGILSSHEQADAVRALTASRRYLDPTRVAIWGWSGGGSSTLQGMFRYPDVYQVGMSVAPVPDERLYDTIYQERYMGLLANPADSARYQRASAINQAEGLKGRLLVVHGSGDDNVHYQGTERLVNRLVALGKPFDFMAYPNRSHCICEGRGTTLHIYSLLTRYLLEHLPAGPRMPLTQ